MDGAAFSLPSVGLAGAVALFVVAVVLWKVLRLALKVVLFIVVAVGLAVGVAVYLKNGRVGAALPLPASVSPR